MFFNIGPMEFVVLAIVGLLVLGPDRLPGLAKDAARMLRTLHELANGARTQLRDELGPEFADVDLRNLNPRTALKRAVLGDELDLGLSPRTFLQDAIADDEPAVQLTKGVPPAESSAAPNTIPAPKPPPLARGERAPFDVDAT
ncbi:MAG: sec-independent translocase [Jatrophihabitantaceae bacterium]